MHYYTFYVKDYMSKTAFLDPLEDIAYRRMMDYIYLNESPLPVDIEEIARKINMRTHSDRIAYVLREFFELTDDGWINDKTEQEIAKYQEKSDKARKSAQARWKKKRSKASNSKASDKSCERIANDNANALQSEYECNANYKLLTNNYELETNTQNSELNIPFDEFWNLYGKKRSRAKCEKKWSKLKDSEREAVMSHLPAYIQSTPDVQFRKDPYTYLNNQSWEDEIINSTAVITNQNQGVSNANSDKINELEQFINNYGSEQNIRNVN